MSEQKISKDIGKKIEKENRKIEALIKGLNDKGLGIQVSPLVDTNIKLAALISCLVEKEIIKGEDYAYELVKIRRMHIEEKIAENETQSGKKLIVPKENGGLIMPR